MTFRRCSDAEREAIGQMCHAGHSFSETGRELDSHKSTISGEMGRNRSGIRARRFGRGSSAPSSLGRCLERPVAYKPCVPEPLPAALPRFLIGQTLPGNTPAVPHRPVVRVLLTQPDRLFQSGSECE
jgi:hypothetical protein